MHWLDRLFLPRFRASIVSRLHVRELPLPYPRLVVLATTHRTCSVLGTQTAKQDGYYSTHGSVKYLFTSARYCECYTNSIAVQITFGTNPPSIQPRMTWIYVHDLDLLFSSRSSSSCTRTRDQVPDRHNRDYRVPTFCVRIKSCWCRGEFFKLRRLSLNTQNRLHAMK